MIFPSDIFISKLPSSLLNTQASIICIKYCTCPGDLFEGPCLSTLLIWSYEFQLKVKWFGNEDILG